LLVSLTEAAKYHGNPAGYPQQITLQLINFPARLSNTISEAQLS